MDSVQRRRLWRYGWRLLEVVSLAVLVSLVAAVFAWTYQYIMPFVVGWLMAVVLLPLVRALERQGMRRVYAALTVLATFVALGLVTLVYTVVTMTREAVQLTANIGHDFRDIRHWVRFEITRGQSVFGALPPKVTSGIENTALQTLTSLESGLRNVVHYLLNSLTMLPEILFIMVVSLVAAFFMLLNRERMYRKFLGALPPGWFDKVDGVVRDMLRALVGTIRVQLILMLLTAVMATAGMMMMHISYAVILGLVLGVAGSIPMLGSAMVTVPWAVGAFVLGDPQLAVKVLVLQLVISLVRHLIEPKILAENVGLDTLSTLFGLYVGMKLMGVLGLFLGPIILIGIKSLLRARMFVDFFPEDELIPEDDAAACEGVPAIEQIKSSNDTVQKGSEDGDL